MKIRQILPIAMLCFVFLVYSIYFVKVVNHQGKLEQNSIAKSIRRSWMPQEKIPAPGKISTVVKPRPAVKQQEPAVPKNPVTQTETKYVNFTWLNVRSAPSLGAPMVEKISENDPVIVLHPSKSGWTEVRTMSGIHGFVATQYLSDTKKPEAITAATPTASVSPAGTSSFDIPVISYHHISDEKIYSADQGLPIVNLLAQLDYLVQGGFKTYTFEDLVAESKIPPQKGVILSFDDGVSDHYQVAQHLNGKGLKGVFFIVTDQIGSKGYLSWDQLKKMKSWGMEIGSHTKSHPDLVVSSSRDIQDQLVGSKAIIEEKLGGDVVSMAYPSGRYDSRVMNAVKEAGYRFARTSDSGSSFSSKTAFKIPTLRVFSPAGAKQFKVWLE